MNVKAEPRAACRQTSYCRQHTSTMYHSTSAPKPAVEKKPILMHRQGKSPHRKTMNERGVCTFSQVGWRRMAASIRSVGALNLASRHLLAQQSITVLGARYTNVPQGMWNPSTASCRGRLVQAAASTRRVHCSRHSGLHGIQPCLKQRNKVLQ